MAIPAIESSSLFGLCENVASAKVLLLCVWRIRVSTIGVRPKRYNYDKAATHGSHEKNGQTTVDPCRGGLDAEDDVCEVKNPDRSSHPC